MVNKIDYSKMIRPTKKIDYSKMIKPTQKVGTLQKMDYSMMIRPSQTEISTEMARVKQQFGGKLPMTREGYIDTREFEKVPQWVLRYNKALDTKVTKAFAKKPKNILGTLLTAFSWAHPYEAVRDVIAEPEKYPNLLSKIGHYFETVAHPTVHPSLRKFSTLFKAYQKGGEPKELEADISLTKFPVVHIAGKKVDTADLFGFLSEMVLDPTSWVYAGVGKLAKAPLLPLVSKAKTTISESMMGLFKKNLVGTELLKMSEEALQIAPNLLTGDVDVATKLLGGPEVFTNILKKVSTTDLVEKALPKITTENMDEIIKVVGKEAFNEASDILLNMRIPGWQNILKLEAQETLPRGLSVIDYLTQKFSKTPYEAKVIDKLRKNFDRGYRTLLENDFNSIMKSLDIADDSLSARKIAQFFDLSYELEGTKNVVKKDIIRTQRNTLINSLTSAEKKGIEYWKKIGEWTEFIEKNKHFGLELDYNHIKNYIFDNYIRTGKEKAYTWLNLSAKRIDPKLRAKPTFTFERQMTTAKAEELGLELASPFERMKARLSLHSKALNLRGYYDEIANMFGETVKGVGLRKIKISPETKMFAKSLTGKYFPEELATYIEKSSEIVNLSNFQQKLLKVITPITSAYKTIWTASMGHQMRNFLGSHTQNAVYFGGNKVLNPKTQELIGKLAWSPENFDFVIQGQKVNSNLFREIFDLSGMSAGWYRTEVTGLQGALGIFKPFRWVGEQVERDARMFAFYSSLNQGDDFIKSILTTKLLHFDYIDGLSIPEKIWGRQIIPMYSWYRFNAPLQARFMIENPYRVSNIFKVWKELGIGTPEETPDWFDDYLMGKVGDLDLANNIQRYLRLDLPIADIALLQPTYEAIMQDKDLPASQRFAKVVAPFVGLSHPFIKCLFELSSNFDTFREQPVYPKVISPLPTFFMDALPEVVKNWLGAEERKSRTGFNVYRIDGMKAKLLENLIPVYQLNVLSGYEKYEGYREQKAKLDKLALMTGIKLYPVDLDYVQKNYKPVMKPAKMKISKKIDYSQMIRRSK